MVCEQSWPWKSKRSANELSHDASTDAVVSVNSTSPHFSAPLWYLFPKLTSSDCALLKHSKIYFGDLGTQWWSAKCWYNLDRGVFQAMLGAQEAMTLSPEATARGLVRWGFLIGVWMRSPVLAFSMGCLRGAFSSSLTKSGEKSSPQSSS